MARKEVNNTKTPVSRVGNKTAILPILYALFPVKYGRFIDVFGGSGSVLLGQSEIRTRITEDYDVRRAALFLKLLRYSYSSGGKSYASQPFDIRRLFELILELQDRMANVVVENQDFEALIRHYDRPDAFFYADPPYLATEDMYAVDFGWDDHVRLRDTLNAIQGKFLLSYNDCPEIRGLYDSSHLFAFSRPHSMAQRYGAGKEFKELLIGNYDLYEREKAKSRQLTIFDVCGDSEDDYEKILKERMVLCKIEKEDRNLS